MGLSRAFMGSLKPHLKSENAKKPNNQTQPLKRLQPELQLFRDTPEGTMHSQGNLYELPNAGGVCFPLLYLPRWGERL